MPHCARVTLRNVFVCDDVFETITYILNGYLEVMHYISDIILSFSSTKYHLIIKLDLATLCYSFSLSVPFLICYCLNIISLELCFADVEFLCRFWV